MRDKLCGVNGVSVRASRASLPEDWRQFVKLADDLCFPVVQFIRDLSVLRD
jgi:hypothetical protein